MKRTLFIFSVFAIIVLSWSSFAMSKSLETSKREQIIAGYVDQLIAKCVAKAELKNSRCINIRREAALSCLKAHFLASHRGKLIKAMIAENIGTKPHQMYYYLNRRFFDRLRNATAALHSFRTAVRRANK